MSGWLFLGIVGLFRGAIEKSDMHKVQISFLYHNFAFGNKTTHHGKNMKIKYQKVTSTDFYQSANFDAMMARLEHIQPNANRLWGQMSVEQMLHHLNLAIGSGLRYYTLPDESNLMSRTVTPFLILNVLQRFPISVSTSKPLIVSESGLDFEQEKAQLAAILIKAFSTKTDADWGRHTYFGQMSRIAWGKLIMIHCNHHFQQFGN
jgi:hypothetical protein